MSASIVDDSESALASCLLVLEQPTPDANRALHIKFGP